MNEPIPTPIIAISQRTRAVKAIFVTILFLSIIIGVLETDELLSRIVDGMRAALFPAI